MMSSQLAKRTLRPRVVLLGAGNRPDFMQRAQKLRPTIEEHAEVVASDFSGANDVAGVDADLAIVFGGDGSILRAAHQMGRRQLPVIAVNLGKLGFLAEVSPGELARALSDYCQGKLSIVEHLMFECEHWRGGHCLERRLGLNEVTIHCGNPFALVAIDLYVDSELVTTYSCDGLIVSTPVGSTAHGLSAGGPILHKELQAFVLVPISPHTLTNRPVVDSADRVYEMVVERPNPGTLCTVDGRVLGALEPADRVRVTRAESKFRLVVASNHSYYRTLREKLGWGGRLRLNEPE